MTNERKINAVKLCSVVIEIFQTCEMSREDASLLADSLVDADPGGVFSHGVLRVPDYVVKLKKEGVDPKGRPSIERDSGSCMDVDGGNSMGQIGASFAM